MSQGSGKKEQSFGKSAALQLSTQNTRENEEPVRNEPKLALTMHQLSMNPPLLSNQVTTSAPSETSEGQSDEDSMILNKLQAQTQQMQENSRKDEILMKCKTAIENLHFEVDKQNRINEEL